MLNQFFASVFTEEDLSNIPTFSLNQQVPLISNEIDFSPERVEQYLDRLQPYKSQGPDNIHAKIIKETKSELSKPLSILFNKVYDTGDIPQIWKSANITPLFKKGDRTLVNNYRPVSLTCILSKIFEKFLQEHLLKHLLQHNLLSLHQHGFRPGHYCATNLLTVIDNWTRALDEG